MSPRSSPEPGVGGSGAAFYQQDTLPICKREMCVGALQSVTQPADELRHQI